MRKKSLIVFIISLAVIAVLLIAISEHIQAQQDQSGNADIAKKLDDILNNQKTIMQRIESLKSELGIIKIRITQQQ